MNPSVAVVQGTTGSWFVVVRQQDGHLQRYECSSQEKAQAFFTLFDEPTRPPRPARSKAPPGEPAGFARRLLGRLAEVLGTRLPPVTATPATGLTQVELPRVEVCRTTQAPWAAELSTTYRRRSP